MTRRLFSDTFTPMKSLATFVLAATCIVAAAQSPQPSKYALFIGIGTYEHKATEIKNPGPGVAPIGRYEPGIVYANLTGPANDVAAMKALLGDVKFGFPKDDKHLIVLPEAQATHDGIMKAMLQYLVTDRATGDTVVLYISSHGSLRPYAAGEGPASGQLYDIYNNPSDLRRVENTVVPYDWYTGADDIFSRDFRHIFNLAAAKGVHLTAIFDACHSGSISRGFDRKKLVAKDFSFDPRIMGADPFPKELSPAPAPQNRADNPVLILSAAQKDQSALDNESDNPAHGLFTSALIDTLNALPADRPADDVLKRLQIAMELAADSQHPQPELDASPERRLQPLFGGVAGNGPATAAVVTVDDSGVLLDIGTVADIGPGSTFTALTGDRVTLEVVTAGPARSTAKITSASHNLQPADIVQLTKGVPWQRPSLLFYAGASNPPKADIQEAAAAVKAANLTLAADPSSAATPWTQHLTWDGTRWVLYSHSKLIAPGHTQPEQETALGAKLNAGALRKIPQGAIVWFDPPLSSESTQALLPDTATIPAKLTPDRGAAKYVVGAHIASSNAIEYAWFKRDDVDSEKLTPPGFGAGCSPNSAYPLRTDYTPDSATALSDSALQLARLNGWLQLQSSPLSSHEQFPYRFTLLRDGTNTDVPENGNTWEGDYYMALVATRPPNNPTPRWVYVIGVDCQGKGGVVWPYDGVPPGQFPPAGMGTLARIPLPGSAFPVEKPFGNDTYLLLTTSSPLASYNALNFKGVVTRGLDDKPVPRGVNPLEDLLDDTSAGSRSRGAPISTDWSVQPIQMQSLPGPPKP